MIKMGVGATLEYIMSSTAGHKKRKNKQLQTVNLKVRMDCAGCELKLNKAMSSLKGVKSVEINRKEQKVTVTGYVDQSKVLKKAKSTGQKAEIWPYVPYNLVPQPYAPPAYNKKAPLGLVRKVDAVTTEDPYITIFSDENPNACSIMKLLLATFV